MPDDDGNRCRGAGSKNQKSDHIHPGHTRRQLKTGNKDLLISEIIFERRKRHQWFAIKIVFS